VEPTVFAGVEESHTIAKEEIFGPVLAIMRAKDFEDAMRIANNIPFGLSSSIQTTNLSRASSTFIARRPGLLTVNLPSAGVEYQLPFGGTKDSSFGPKEQGPAAHGVLQRLQDGLPEVLSASARTRVSPLPSRNSH
jgi:alpha-ketoglutaric semialdehyde dehydrogenase